MQHNDTQYGVSPPPDTPALIQPADFARMHLDHLTAHPPDSVLFPFLHGLEGENAPQCMFFTSSGTPDKPVPNAGMIRDQQGRVLRPPRYRGLVWVLADEDIERPSSPSWDDEYDSDSEDFSDEDHDVEMGYPEADFDSDSHQTQHIHHHHQAQDNYMHPLTLRISTADSDTNTKTSVPFPSAPLNIAYTNASPPPYSSHDRRDSSASSTESSSSSTDASSVNSDSLSISTCATSLPSPSSCPPVSFDSRNSPLNCHDTSQNSSVTVLPHKHTRSKFPILTCSFVPSELIQPCPPPRTYDSNGWRRAEPWFEIDWEFKPAKVPEGISLRNFGVQVSLYSSISDIVVYSPKGPTPVTFRIAERFRKAIARKRRERLERWYQAGFGSDPAKIWDEGEDPHSTPDGFLKYGVYVLDANAEQLKRDLPWLIMRKDGECDGDCEQTAAPAPPAQGTCCTFGDGMTHGLTEATDGRLVGELEIEARLAAEQGVQSVPHAQDLNAPQVPQSTVHLNANARLHRCRRANTIDFAQREKDEMRDLTRASEILTVWNGDAEREVHADTVSGSTTATYWNPNVGQVFLGNASDVPLWRPSLKRRGHVRPPSDPIAPSPSSVPPSSTYLDPFSDFESETPSPFNPYTNDPSRGLGFDICIECHEHAPLSSVALLRAAEEHVRTMEVEWVEGWRRNWRFGASPSPTVSPSDTDAPPSGSPLPGAIPPRPPPHPSAIIHLSFPSTPLATPAGLNILLPVIKFLERMVTPGGLGCLTTTNPSGAGFTSFSNGSAIPKTPIKSPKAPSPWSPILESPCNSPSGSNTPSTSTGGNMSNGYPMNTQKTDARESASATPSYRPRPLKVLLHSSDGYTESSVPALCLLMAVKGLSLPEAYLEMQVTNRRSFFVYQSEVGLLRKVEARLGVWNSAICSRYHYADIPRGLVMRAHAADHPPVTPSQAPRVYNRPHALTINHGRMPPSTREMQRPRARASTLPSFIPDHQCWFDDPRFDGSFPSRVLPFLYLGNLNHATNAYMLHALGITHVVSVGECALVPPLHTPEDGCPGPSPQPPSPPNPSPSTTQFAAGPGNQGSLWIEEREGRIKVLDIKGVCDDGIDTLEPQLHPICDWIERARLSGGRVLVHCRVGVSRSATVTIAYVMQHLGLSLVEAYLVVRSRRLSVLIQPNMRLLYNLLGWEVRLARERAGGDVRRLREELGRALSWPYLAREVHALNEKYLS